MKKLDYSTQLIEKDDIDEVVKVLQSPFITQGKQIEAFEEALCTYTGAKYAISFNSATSALFCAYKAAGIEKGDEIITSPISFVATSNMFVELGATPIWCDVRLDGNIDESKIEALITSKTKAIVPIHFAGKPVALKKIHEIAARHKLLVIEDAAHALGSSINGKKIGSFSDMSIFSFHAIKPITTGEGGAVLTNNKEYATTLKLLRSHGITKKGLYNSNMSLMGYNFRLTEIAGALGLSQLQKLDRFIAKRNEISSFYDEAFKEQKLFLTQKLETDTVSARHLYPIILNPEFQCVKEEIFQELTDAKIGCQVHYKPIYQNSFYKEKFGDASLEVANDFYLCEISIPCHQKMTLEDAKYVADTFLAILQNYKHRACSF
jgi:UDP-4-amino-4,6-dideoxy-L-N-acetyl-beta-L-altrosamine transaminase